MMYNRRPMIEVIEELTVVGTRAWVVPDGCTSVDIFMVGGGRNGTAPPPSAIIGGFGGDGGYIKTVLNMPVVPKSYIFYSIAAANNDATFFYNQHAISGSKHAGGAGVAMGSGNNGVDGEYPFGDVSFGKRYGASGGSGGMFDPRAGGGTGGRDGAGNGGNPLSNNINGVNASFYGAGGGGGGFVYNTPGSGGTGYQGIIILRYKKYK